MQECSPTYLIWMFLPKAMNGIPTWCGWACFGCGIHEKCFMQIKSLEYLPPPWWIFNFNIRRDFHCFMYEFHSKCVFSGNAKQNGERMCFHVEYKCAVVFDLKTDFCQGNPWLPPPCLPDFWFVLYYYSVGLHRKSKIFYFLFLFVKSSSSFLVISYC